jgi:dipeptidyl-peptidase-4
MKRLLSVFAIFAVLAGVSGQAAEGKKKLTLDLVTQPGAIVARGIRAMHWRPGHEQISYVRTKGSGAEAASTLYLYDVGAGKEEVFFSPPAGKPGFALDSYQWDPRGEALLFSAEGDLWRYDVTSRGLRRLTDDPEEEELPTFAPSGNRIAFVKDNDIFTMDLSTGLLKKLTNDGSENVLNGKLDWVYEEEIANRATGRAYEWSPDGTRIAYLRLDDTPVPQYPLTEFLATHARVTEQRFPQAGDPNPVPTVHVVAVAEGRAQVWTLPLDRREAEYVNPYFAWTPDSQSVSFVSLNRAQDEAVVHLWNPAAGADRVLVREKDSTWINWFDPPRFLADGQRFLWISERDGWMRLYLYGLDGKLIRQLTIGKWMLDRPMFSDVPLFQVDDAGGRVYFLATNPDPRERQIYRVWLEDARLERLSQEAGMHRLALAPNGRYFTDLFSNFETPPETRLYKSDGTFAATLDKPENHLAEYELAKTEFLEVKAVDGATLYARLAKPADFDPKKKYPVIVDVYNGPNIQLVQNRWGVTSLLHHFYAQEGYLIWSLDGRGSWGRGHAWEWAVFKKLGQRELEDQLAGVEYLKSLPYVDPKRIAIHGWSYGGYMTLYALTHAPGVFKCGVAGAPVTDWKFYDSIYTERYMRTPKENPEGYKTSSPLEAAAKLTDRLLLIHGADDDNVHLQNSLSFINQLVGAGRFFDLYIQPGQRHGFTGPAVQNYLERRILEFLRQNL